MLVIAGEADSTPMHHCHVVWSGINCYILFPQTHSLQDMRQQAAIAAKVFIQRDYTNGTVCQFQTKFPSELETRVGHTSSLCYL